MMSRARVLAVLAGLILVSATAAAAAFSPLAAFDLVVSKDGGSTLTAEVAYGPEPRQRLDIYRPDSAAGASPVVVFFYGGSWNSGSKDDYSFVGRALAAQGFVTVIPDYRLVPEVRYPAFVEDGAQALAFVEDTIAAQGGDPARMGVVGHSAGAYIALMLALDQRFATAAGVSNRLRAAAGLSGPYNFLPLDADATIAAFGEVDDLPATQPTAHARADAPPVLLLHGENDTLVYPRNSVALAQAVTETGGEAALGLYPNMDHKGTLLALSRWFRKEEGVHGALVEFLRARL